MCCSSPSFDLNCVLRVGSGSQGSYPQISTVSCSSGYEMVGCTVSGLYGDANAMYISNDICYAKSRYTEVFASAIWYVFVFFVFIIPAIM